MCILHIRRWCSVLLLPLGLAACGYDGAELIPPGLRATLAAEDRAAKPGDASAKPISVDQMLSRARGDKSAPLADPSAPQPSDRPATPPPAIASTDSAHMAPQETIPQSASANIQTGAQTSSGTHPLWSQMMTERRPGALPPAQASQQGVARALPQGTVPPVQKVAAPPNARTVVLSFPGSETELSGDERRRLDAAVALHKVSSNAARIMAGPSGERAPFEQLLIAERRSRAIESALPAEIQHSRAFSPEINNNTVRVEFETSTPAVQK